MIHLAWAIQPSRDAVTLRADQRRRQRPGLRGGGRGRGAEAGPRLLGRRLLARAEGSGGRRELAGRGHPDLVLLAPQGRGGARARPLRSRQSRDAGRAASPGADLQGRGRDRDPPPLRRAVPAQLPPAPAASSSRCPESSACAFRPCTPRTSGGPTCRRSSPTSTAHSTSPPSRRSARRRWPSGSACGASRCRARVVRRLADLSWRLRLQPTPPGWLDMALNVPLMSSERARDELGWEPRHSGVEALEELLEGMREGHGAETPPLEADSAGARLEDLKTGVGARQWDRDRDEQLVKYLADVHSIELQALAQLRAAPKIAGDERIAERLRAASGRDRRPGASRARAPRGARRQALEAEGRRRRRRRLGDGRLRRLPARHAREAGRCTPTPTSTWSSPPTNC